MGLKWCQLVKVKCVPTMFQTQTRARVAMSIRVEAASLLRQPIERSDLAPGVSLIDDHQVWSVRQIILFRDSVLALSKLFISIRLWRFWMTRMR